MYVIQIPKMVFLGEKITCICKLIDAVKLPFVEVVWMQVLCCRVSKSYFSKVHIQRNQSTYTESNRDNLLMGFPGGSVSKESTSNTGLDPWVRKIPWRRKWQLTPVFLPGNSHGPQEPGRVQSMGLQRVGYN